MTIELKVCAASLHYASWPGQSCESPILSRMFHLKVVTTARHRILCITSAIPIGLTPGFLSKGVSSHVIVIHHFCIISWNIISLISLPCVLTHYKDLDYYPQAMIITIMTIIPKLECDATHLYQGLMGLLSLDFTCNFVYKSTASFFIWMFFI